MIKQDGLWLLNGDCLERMKEIPDGSIDMILTDPPYGTVKGVGESIGILHGMKHKTEWDMQLPTDQIMNECNRVLRKNGTLILFSQEPFTSELIQSAHSNIPFAYRMIWVKDHFANPLSASKAPLNYYEDVNVFFKKNPKEDIEMNHPVRDYARKIFGYINKTNKDIYDDMGDKAICHFMRFNSSQFRLCTRKTYEKLIELYHIDKIDGFYNFDELSQQNIDYRAALIKKMQQKYPKVFNLPNGKKFKSNILEYKKDYDGLHPTQKPIALMDDLIKTYTNPSETVLDFTMGSGSTGVAALRNNRKFIGIELDPTYYGIACDRVLTEASLCSTVSLSNITETPQ